MNIWPSLLTALGQSLRADSSAKGLELRIGEVVQATLVEMISEHSAAIQIKGQTLQVQVETQLPKGASFSLVVVGMNENGIMELKISPGVPSQKGESFPLPKLLKNLQVEDTPLTRQITGRLLAENLSVSPSLVKTIQALLEQAKQDQVLLPKSLPPLQQMQQAPAPLQQLQPTPSRADISLETLVAMVRKNIPLTTATFQAMRTVWFGPPLSQVLPKLFPVKGAVSEGAPFEQATSTTTAFTTRNANESPAGGSDPVFLSKAASQQPSLSVKDATLNLQTLAELPLESRGMALRETVQQLGLSHEHQLHLASKTGGEMPPETLKAQLLTQLQANLEDPEIQLAISHLTGQQLMQSVKDDTNPFFYQYFALPVQTGETAADAQVHLLTRKREGRRLDPYNCFLYFHLQLPSLGELGLHVQIVERMVSLRFLLEEENRLQLEEPELAFLREQLQKVGYQLGTVRKEAGAAENLSPFSQLPSYVANGVFDLRI